MSYQSLPMHSTTSSNYFYVTNSVATSVATITIPENPYMQVDQLPVPDASTMPPTIEAAYAPPAGIQEFEGKTPHKFLTNQNPFQELKITAIKALSRYAGGAGIDSPSSSEFASSIIKCVTCLPSSPWFAHNRFNVDEYITELKKTYPRTVKIVSSEPEPGVYQLFILVKPSDEAYYIVRIIPCPNYVPSRILEYGFNGHGLLLRDFADGLGLSFSQGLLENKVVADGKDLGSISITTDQHSLESIMALDRSYPRLTYGLPNEESLFNLLTLSPFFNLSCAKLDDNLQTTVVDPRPSLLAFQEYVRRRMPSSLFPVTLSEKQKVSLDKGIVNHCGDFDSRKNAMFDAHYRVNIQVSKLDEVRNLLGLDILEFTYLTNKLKAKVGEHRFESEILSSNPLSLVEKLKLFA